MLAPLLYMLALAGIGAAVMFSGYSQILRSNADGGHGAEERG